MEAMAVEDLDARGTLASVGRLRRVRDDAERRIFVSAAHYADLFTGEALNDERSLLPGMDQGVRLGGVGTPLVAELALAELGAELGITSFSARLLVGDAVETRHRLPLLWGRVRSGEVPVWIARKVARETRPLSVEQAGFVDAEVAEYADGRLPFTRFAALLAGKVVAADPEAAAERERAAAAEQFAKVGRSNEHGQKTLYVRTDAAAIIRIDATVDYLARALSALGDPDPLERLRVKALLVLANPVAAVQLLHTYTDQRDAGGAVARFGDEDAPLPEPPGEPDGDRHPAMTGDPTAFTRPFRPGELATIVAAATAGGAAGSGFVYDPRRLLPTVTLYLHVAAESLTEGAGVVRWEEEGPVSTSYLRDFLGPYCRFTVKPVIDLAGQAPVDGYEIPARLRQAVHLRSPADVFPYGSSTSRRTDLDHTRPYRPPDDGGPPGQTSARNLGPLTRYHHRVKTHTAWQVRQPFPGIYLWRAPHGALYLVDHTGTRQIRATSDGPGEPSNAGSAGQLRPVASITPLERRFAELVTADAA